MTIDFLIALFLIGSPAAVLVLLLLYGLHRSRRREAGQAPPPRRFEVIPRREAPGNQRGPSHPA